MQYASEKDKAQASARTNQRLDALLASLIEKDQSTYPVAGLGMEAVAAGNKWFQRLNGSYGFALLRPPVRQAIERLANRRAGDLTAAAPAIIAEISKQTGEKGVDNLTANYLCVDGDSRTAPAASIFAAADSRKKEIRREAVLALYSPHERQWLAPDGRISIPSAIPPPDADDLRVALVRTLEMMGGERVGPFTIHMSTNPIAQRVGIYLIIQVNEVEKPVCTQVSGGYLVSYRPHISCNWSEGFEKFAFSQPSFSGIALQGLTARLNGPQGTKEDRFELSDRGWFSPSMRANGMNSGE